MSLSEAQMARCNEALDALRVFRDTYSDVLVVLDYVSLTDIANYQPDSSDGVAGSILTADEMAAVLWHVGKHAGNTGQDVLASLVEFALDEHARRNLKA